MGDTVSPRRAPIKPSAARPRVAREGDHGGRRSPTMSYPDRRRHGLRRQPRTTSARASVAAPTTPASSPSAAATHAARGWGAASTARPPPRSGRRGPVRASRPVRRRSRPSSTSSDVDDRRDPDAERLDRHVEQLDGQFVALGERARPHLRRQRRLPSSSRISNSDVCRPASTIAATTAAIERRPA